MKRVEIHSLPHLTIVLSIRKQKDKALQTLALQPGAGSTTLWSSHTGSASEGPLPAHSHQASAHLALEGLQSLQAHLQMSAELQQLSGGD